MLRIVRIGVSKKAQHPEAIYTFVTGRVYTVGRRHCDLALEDDTSISRNHGEIQMDHPIANLSNPALPPSIIVTDVGSKFGTYVNNGIETKSKVSLKEPQILSAGDTFRFGLQWNVYKIEYTPLIVCSAILNNLTDLETTICTLGGHLIPEWRIDSNFLVLESLTITVKVICALLSGKPIVRPEYFEEYLKAVKTENETDADGDGELKLPSSRDYLPSLTEKSLLQKEELFHPNPSRKKLFLGKYFVIVNSKTMKTYSIALKSAGAEVGALLSVSSGILMDDNTIVVGNESDLNDSETKVHAAIDMYVASGKRVIPESEIGLAALYMDTSTYCNPNPAKPQPGLTKSLIADESQDPAFRVFHTQSLLGRNVITESQKRDFSNESQDGASGSKRRLESSGVSTNQKRPRDDDDSGENDSKKNKRLAAYFAMTDSEDEDEKTMAPPPFVPIPMPVITNERTSRSQGRKIAESTEEIAANTLPLDFENSSIVSEGTRRSQRNQRREHIDSQRSHIVDATQDEENEIIPSGYCPASPEILSQIPTLVTPLPPQLMQEARSIGEKRKQGEEEIIVETDIQSISTKKRRLLQQQTVVNESSEVGMQLKPKDKDEDGEQIMPLGFSFASLVLRGGSRPSEPPQRSNNDCQRKNYKTFRKVSPIFASNPPMQITLVPHNQMVHDDSFEVSVQVGETEAPAGSRRGRNRQPPTAAQPPPSRRRRNEGNGVPRTTANGFPPAQIIHTNEEEDEFSFH